MRNVPPHDKEEEGRYEDEMEGDDPVLAICISDV
jgi:hypothetical protein